MDVRDGVSVQLYVRLYLAPICQVALGQDVQVRQLKLYHCAQAQQRPTDELRRVCDEGRVQQENGANVVVPRLLSPRHFVRGVYEPTAVIG